MTFQHQTLAALCALAFAGTAQADFVGDIAPGNFITATSGSYGGATPNVGSAVFTPSTLTLTGGDDSLGCNGGMQADATSPCQVQTVANLHGTVSFDYLYHTDDASGPAYDLFNVLLDGVAPGVTITDPGAGSGDQSGHRSYYVNASFGWLLNCTDCTGGSANVTISNLAFVPEPGSVALVLGAIGALALSRRSAAR